MAVVSIAPWGSAPHRQLSGVGTSAILAGEAAANPAELALRSSWERLERAQAEIQALSQASSDHVGRQLPNEIGSLVARKRPAAPKPQIVRSSAFVEGCEAPARVCIHLGATLGAEELARLLVHAAGEKSELRLAHDVLSTGVRAERAQQSHKDSR